MAWIETLSQNKNKVKLTERSSHVAVVQHNYYSSEDPCPLGLQTEVMGKPREAPPMLVLGSVCNSYMLEQQCMEAVDIEILRE